MSFDINKIRSDFPILKKKINGKQLIYFDNAATSQTPNCVIDSISDYYKNYNSNIHRGVHSLSEQATESYEDSREKIRAHFNAKYKEEIIFTSGTTHSINIVSNGFVKLIGKGDEIIVSGLEHHSNIVPWQMMCEKNNAKLNVIPINDDGELNLDEFKKIVSKKTKIVFLNHVSNALGIINPIEEIIKLSHENGAYVLIDGAQSAAHFKIDLQHLDVDFFTASAHKLCDYLNKIGFNNIEKYELELLDYATTKLKKIDGLKIYGDVKNKTSVISFNIIGIHSYDIGSILDKYGVAVRTGQHCAQPIMDYFNIPGTVRVSLSFLNTFDEIDILCEALLKAKSMLS